MAWISGLICQCRELDLADSNSMLGKEGDGLRERQHLVELCRACVTVGTEDHKGPIVLESFRVLAARLLLSESERLILALSNPLTQVERASG